MNTMPTWFVINKTPPGDFTESVEDMLREYLKAKWGTTITVSPEKSTNPPADYSSKVRFGDVEYDYFATYYIRVKEDDTQFNNDFILSGGPFMFSTPCNIDITARRLKYGEHFTEMNNMRLEVIRILGNYKPDDISGISSIDTETPGERDIERRNYERQGKAQKTIWYLRIRAICHYMKAYECMQPVLSPTHSFAADSFAMDSFDI